MIDETIVTAINVVGFPIVAFFAMFYMANVTIKSNTEALMEIKEEFAARRND